MKFLIFDFDGTLFDSRQDIANAVNHARRVFELPGLTLPEVTSMVGNGVEVLAQRAFRDSGVAPGDGLAAISEYYRDHPCDETRPYPGVVETLPLLSQALTIVSNKPKHLVESVLEKFGLSEAFEFVAGGDTFSEKKPSPVGVNFLRERFAVSRESILVIGDHSPDIEMAKAAGVRSVYCNYGFFGNDTVGADWQIEKFSEILSVIDKWELSLST